MAMTGMATIKACRVVAVHAAVAVIADVSINPGGCRTEALQSWNTNRAEYLDIPLHTCNATLSAAYAKVTESNITGTINQYFVRSTFSLYEQSHHI
jgi:hypothetical protein